MWQRGRLLITTYHKAVLIYNPRAGALNGKCERILARAADLLEAAQCRATLVPTSGPWAAREIARNAVANGADLILVAGGDGTVNEVINGMALSRVPMAVLPAGTANVLARETGMSCDAVQAARLLAGWTPCRIPLGLLRTAEQSRYFLLMAGIGLDARVVHELDLALKARLRKLAYWVAGFRQLGRRLEEFQARIGSESFRCSFALASRVRNYGGDLEIARSVRLPDDDFEFVLFEGAESVRYLKYLGGALAKRLAGMKGVTFRRGVSASFAGLARPVHVQVDGEYAGRLPATVEIVPDALTLLLPAGYGAAR